MHPALDELIAVRDGGGAPQSAAHVAGCPECRAEVERLGALRRELAGLPARPARRDLWPVVQARRSRERRARWVRYAGAAAALALAGGLGAALWLAPRKGAPPTPGGAAVPAAEPAAGAPEDPRVRELIVQSQTLEQVLKQYEGESTVLSSRSAGAIADLQDRVALIDLQIGMAEDGSVPQERLQELWEYRVKLLASMVELHSSRGAFTTI